MIYAGPWPPSIQFPGVSNRSCISQACTPIFFRSFSTLSSHLLLGFPTVHCHSGTSYFYVTHSPQHSILKHPQTVNNYKQPYQPNIAN